MNQRHTRNGVGRGRISFKSHVMKTFLVAFRNSEWTKTGGVQEYEQSAGKSEFKTMWINQRDKAWNGKTMVNLFVKCKKQRM